MAYWEEWKSLVGGGIGFVVLAIFMVALSTLPGAEGATGAGGLDMMQIGILFAAVGIAMVILGVVLRKP